MPVSSFCLCSDKVLAVQELKSQDKEAYEEGVANFEYNHEHPLEPYLGKEYSFDEDEIEM